MISLSANSDTLEIDKVKFERKEYKVHLFLGNKLEENNYRN